MQGLLFVDAAAAAAAAASRPQATMHHARCVCYHITAGSSAAQRSGAACSSALLPSVERRPVSIAVCYGNCVYGSNCVQFADRRS